MSNSIFLFVLFNITFLQTNAFSVSTNLQRIKSSSLCLKSTEVSDFDDTTIESVENPHPASNDNDDDNNQIIIENMEEREKLKKKLYELCASYDRGFGASPRARSNVQTIVDQLEMINPTTANASRGLDGQYTEESIPLEGAWRMIWTTALDVLSLGASPIATPSAIYQVFEPPICTNIIDFIPRVQFLLPTSFPSTLIRAKVKTRTSIRASSTNRVGLNFEAVKLEPVEVLGAAVPAFIPSFNVNFPTSIIDIEKLPGIDPENAPGYFDVLYLDDDILVITQNAPGGYFVLVKVDNYDP